MSSDEEDFNDIYGDEPAAPAVAPDASAAPEPAPEPVTATAADSTTAEAAPASAPADASSSLDQLAALQALSSNIAGTTQNKEESANETNQSAAPSGGSAAATWDQLQQTMSQFQQEATKNAAIASPPTQQVQSPSAQTQNSVKADLSRENCKMFVGGLNWETTEEGLTDYFSKYGKVVDLKIMKDPNTGKSRGFGFLSFDNPQSVDEVVKSQHILDGKVIDPKRAIPREEQDKTGKIFVGGIGADVRPKEFEEFFAQWGSIIDAQLMLDKDTGRSRGFGFVTYDSPDAVDRVCQNKYIDFKGKRIEIKRAEPRHLQKQNQGSQGSMGNPAGMMMGGYGGGYNPMQQMSQMYQSPMVGGFNPMFNPQAMTDYYQKMQEYYQQLQQQTGVDYTQMFQQQMQQMQMMMPGFNMGAAAGSGSPQPASSTNSSESNTPNMNDGNAPSSVPTIGDESESNRERGGRGRNGSGDGRGENRNAGNGNNQSPPMNIPRGPRGGNNGNSGGHGRHSGGGGGSRSGGSYRSSRSGYSRRNNNGYHPYNR